MTKYSIIAYLSLLVLVASRVYFSCTFILQNGGINNSCATEIPSSKESVGIVHDKYDKDVQKYLPSPHAELLLGLTIGADYLSRLSRFNDMLKKSGTIHVAVVSGFNVSLVFNFLVRTLGSRYKLKNYMIATFVTLFYAFLSGFEPPVVRAWLMGSTISLGKVYGRLINPLYVLILIAVLMILYNPAYAFSLSFQLSFLATLGLIVYSEPVKIVIAKFTKSKSVIFEDLAASLSAQLLVWPLISYRFGTVSLISPVSNAFLLWTIPIATILGFCLLLSLLFSNILSLIFSFLSFIFIDIFAKGVEFFSSFEFSSMDLEITAGWMVVYYALIFSITLLISKRKQRHEN